MKGGQEPTNTNTNADTTPRIHAHRLGALPLINHYLERLQLTERLQRFIPTHDPRIKIPYALTLTVLLRSLLVEREPIYRQAEIIAAHHPSVMGLNESQAAALNDDTLGRALDRLFDADRASFITDLLVGVTQAFALDLSELHNDSTTVTFTGQYQHAVGREVRNQRAPLITHGFNKDHRPDLKQLLLILTTTSDGSVPIQFRCADGNQSDSTSHQATWITLRELTGTPKFLYIADSKLCSREAMEFIDGAGGRFITVMPRNRLEDAEFRKGILTQEPDWIPVRDEPHPRDPDGLRDRWWVHRARLPSGEGWPITWVWSNHLALKQQHRRRERIARATEQLDELNQRLTGPKPRHRTKHEIHDRIQSILKHNRVTPYLKVTLHNTEEHSYKQTKRGRPGPNTEYKRHTKRGYRLTITTNDQALRDADKSSGMYPLLSNDTNLTPQQVFEAHKRQPSIEKRFEQTKTVLEIAPVLLKNESRIEALFTIHYLALLTQALIERDLRNAMRDHDIQELPLYPEERTTTRPTAEQILRLYTNLHQHTLTHNNATHTIQPELTPLQQQVLHLLEIPTSTYTNTPSAKPTTA
jgi:transposase